ncbi:homocysteine S-methyltransferase family protein [Reyranella sp.]|uniref:homocysteine S-methyltransferase family protein n=1 Tax=Reyranella sp. TaxID=1929291 RepID=UPI003BAC08D1
MASYRNALPQTADRLFLTDGGMETTLVFLQGVELPHFAAFPLVEQPDGAERLRAYYRTYLDIARAAGLGFVLETPTWRANADWGARLGCDAAALAKVNAKAVALMAELRDAYAGGGTPVVVSGNIGPRGDGYDPGQVMSEAEAEAYHGQQIATFAATEADLVTAMTLTNVPEAIGVARAARAHGLPSVISFTLETDGRLPTGQTLGDAIEATDRATDGAPDYYMINCAHPSHFADVLGGRAPWLDRVRGLRANASRRSHAELDQAPDLDDGDPVALGAEYRALQALLPRLTVLGGCCGTDHRHVDQICRICAPPRARAD